MRAVVPYPYNFNTGEYWREKHAKKDEKPLCFARKCRREGHVDLKRLIPVVGFGWAPPLPPLYLKDSMSMSFHINNWLNSISSYQQANKH
jgi:hypothetical protein